MTIRDVLLAVHAVGWLIAVITVAIRAGEIPATLWGALPLGVSGILLAFRAGNGTVAPRPHKPDGNGVGAQ